MYVTRMTSYKVLQTLDLKYYTSVKDSTLKLNEIERKKNT